MTGLEPAALLLAIKARPERPADLRLRTSQTSGEGDIRVSWRASHSPGPSPMEESAAGAAEDTAELGYVVLTGHNTNTAPLAEGPRIRLTSG
jgi:hypothetical protein